jgi:isoquinoline 1-oxidoreductase beta subunit
VDNLGNAVAVVVAGNTWKAIQASRSLSVRWSLPSNTSSMDSAQILTQAQQLMASGTPGIAEKAGDPSAATGRQLEMTYYVPYLAHACMEVLNCTVNLTPTSCEIWAPTQAPGLIGFTVAGITGLSPSQVTVHTTYLGGGLGRKFEQDFISQAVQVAKAIGKPVKLTWPREEDFQHDQYRPMALSRVRATLDPQGNVLGWANRIVSPSILFQRGNPLSTGVDSQGVEGAINLPYAFGSRLVEYIRHPSPIPVGFWRSVGNSINAFIVESAIDELALAAGVDPLAYRQRLLAGSARHLNVLNAAANLGGWNTPVPTGHARGIAICSSFGSIVAEMAEISQVSATEIKVHKVACAVDCGRAINPDLVRGQMEGGIVHGLTAAMWGQVTFTQGRANVRNFSNYRMLRMQEMPQVSVEIIESGAPIGGIGEPGVPPIAPAVVNAYARLTGQRIRSLPMFPSAAFMGELD